MIPVIIIAVLGIIFTFNHILFEKIDILEGSSIQGNKSYEPNDLTFKKGTILKINNLDSDIHTVTEGNSNNFSSIKFDTGIIPIGGRRMGYISHSSW